MKKLKGSLFAKTIAVILFCALCLGFAFCALAAVNLYTAGFYKSGYEIARKNLMSDLCRQEGWEIARRIVPTGEYSRDALNLCDNDLFRFEVFDSNGVLRASTLGDGEDKAALASGTVSSGYWYEYSFLPPGSMWGEEGLAEEQNANSEETPDPERSDDTAEPAAAEEAGNTAAEPEQTVSPAPAETQGVKIRSDAPTPVAAEELVPAPTEEPIAAAGDGREVHYTVVCYMLAGSTEGGLDFASVQLRCFDFAAVNSDALFAAAAISLVLAILLFVFLISAAGHRAGTDEIKPGFIEKIPFDILTALVAFACIWLLWEISDFPYRLSAPAIAAVALIGLLAGFLVLLWCMSLAVRVKLGTLLGGMLIVKLLRMARRVLKAVLGWLKMLLLGIPLVWRGLLILCAAAFVGLIFAVVYRRDALGLWVCGNFILFPLAIWGLISARRLRDGAKEIASGNTDCRVSVKYLFGELRRHAEDLNSIRDGVSRAVEERMRSERMKTELITNVSHDIKTPLTSIISYVDLLSKEELDNEKAKEYIEVLQRQSARLKKLTDDLVEASKASSGVLEVNPERCDLSVMLDQTAGEYGERLEKAGLVLVVRKPETGVYVMADARHTQRIFDNLMGNIVKYAMSGTRVFIDLADTPESAAVIFRNTSRSMIEQSADELAERFVRGDSARGGEGSGLGLSIAKSLAELQGGSLKIDVDGDLFKVTLGFKRTE